MTELTRALQGRQEQVAELVETARQWQAGLEALRTTIETVLQQMPHRAAAFAGVAGPAPSSNGSAHVPAELISRLNQWHSSGAPADCPLPELYRRVLPIAPSLTIGRFHDGLRQLHEGGQVYLHPWSGPLYEIPEPAFALLVGHEVAYYASVRDHSPLTTHHSPR